jgi:hypothetical protein
MNQGINKGASNFWILMTLGCGVCMFALLYNRFYDPLPIMGLVLFAALFIFLAVRARKPKKQKDLPEGMNHEGHYVIDRKGSNAALGFWILMIGACGACIFALLYNHFYDAWPIIGLIVLVVFFLFCAFATRWKERIEFRENELFYAHVAKISKTRSWVWPYSELYVKTERHSSRVKNGNTYTTVISYSVSVMNGKTGGGIPIHQHLGDSLGAETKAQFYRDLMSGKFVKKDIQQPVKSDIPGRPKW